MVNYEVFLGCTTFLTILYIINLHLDIYKQKLKRCQYGCFFPDQYESTKAVPTNYYCSIPYLTIHSQNVVKFTCKKLEPMTRLYLQHLEQNTSMNMHVHIDKCVYIVTDLSIYVRISVQLQ